MLHTRKLAKVYSITLYILLFTYLILFSSFSKAMALKVGTMVFDPPYESISDDRRELYGFDIELMDMICNKIGARCIYKAMTFNKIFQALDDQKIDVAISAISITPDRKKTYLFSIPYSLDKAQFLSLKKYNYKNIAALENKTIGIIHDSIYPAILHKLFGTNINMKFFKNDGDLVLALRRGEVQAILMDSLISYYWQSNADNLDFVGKTIPAGEGLGIMATKDKQALIDKINQAILEIEADGSYIKLYQQYF